MNDQILRRLSAFLLFHPVPLDMRSIDRRDIIRSRESIATGTYEKDGVLYWTSNDAVVPPHVFDAARLPMPDRQKAAREEEVERSLRAYRENPPEVTPEMMFEMRAAFGPGETVVDVITGREYRL